MDSARETIAYLARSGPRVEVLDAIRTEPRTREALRALADVEGPVGGERGEASAE